VKPRALDLYCGAGGAAVGYHRAGYEVVGVDREPQPNYPFEFIQADAIEFLALHGREYDLRHASPPCQRYSPMSNCRPGLAEEYPDLIPVTRAVLELIGGPYVIENVPGSSLRVDVELCGQTFGLPLYRHRWFESNVPMLGIPHAKHRTPASRAGHWKPGTIMSVSGHVSPIAEAKRAMGIDWMTRDELAESIPPDYTQWIGEQLMYALERQEVAS
jgi:DNA (cytosine-5)-methyltransferase 1